MNQEKIGKYIVECRKKKNMTQQELAEKLGVSDRTIGNWENGRNMPDLSLFKPLSEILGISIAELIDGGKIDKNNIAYKSEEILTNTINYQTEKIRKKENKYIFFICFLSLIIIIALNVNNIFNNDSLEYLPLIVLGVIFIFLGIMNYKGNISSIHWYNRRNVSKKDVKIRINSVVCKTNLNSIDKLTSFLNNYNIYSWRIFKFMPLREKAVINKEMFDISMKEYDDVVKKLKEKSNIKNIDTRVVEDMENKYILILANGDIVITNNGKDEKVGNALTNSLADYL